ncbi:MAG: glycosyltransferase family 39 protein [Acidobacteriota bacterium]
MAQRVGRLAITAGIILAFGNELLSLLHLFSFWPLLILWSATAAGCGWIIWRKRGVGRASIVNGLLGLRFDEKVVLALLGVLLACAFLSGLLSPPDSWDSMVFHLPRQVRWIQQASLEHFPSRVAQQLFRGPYAETLQASLQILTRTDLTTQLVSWGALLLCLLYVYLMAGQIGASRRWRLLGLLFGVCVPIAFLEASTTKNDLVVAAWSLAAIWLVLGALKAGTLTRRDALSIGFALGLAGLTKSTAYMLLVPFLPVLAYAVLRRRDRLACGLLVLAGFISINAGHWVRNTRTFGLPTGPASSTRIHMNAEMSLPRFLSRLSREASLELATPSDSFNQAVEGAVREWHRWLGIDVLDPATTYPGRPFVVLFLPYNEYQASAPVQFVLLLLLPVGGLIWRRRLAPLWWTVAFLPWAVFGWLCLISKWEPYLNPRLHLLLFFVAAPALAALLGAAFRERGRGDGIQHRAEPGLVLALAGLLVLQVLPSVISSERSLFGPVFRPRSELLFVEGKHLRPLYEAAAEEVRSLRPTVLGIDSGGDWAWEYPLMRLVRRNLYEPEFVTVNPTLVAERAYSAPDVIVVFRPVDTYTDRASGRTYRATGHFGFLTVLR